METSFVFYAFLLSQSAKMLVHFRRKNTHCNSLPALKTQSFRHGSCLKAHVTRGFLRQEATVAHLAEHRGDQEAGSKQQA